MEKQIKEIKADLVLEDIAHLDFIREANSHPNVVYSYNTKERKGIIKILKS